MQQTNPIWLISQAPKDLKAQILAAVRHGYHVTSQTDHTAQLFRAKKFSCLFGLLSLFCFGVGFFVYLVYYLSKGDDTIYLDVSVQPSKEDLEKMSAAIKAQSWVKQHPILVGVIAFFIILIAIIVLSSGHSNSTGTAQTNTTSTQAAAEAAKPKEFKEIFSLKGNGNRDSQSFSTSGGTLKMVARTDGSSVGSFSGIELKSEDGSYLGGAELMVNTDGPKDGNGETIIRNAKAGKYFISVISGVGWDVKVYEEQ